MILVKTEAGLQVLKDRSVRLMPRQRSAFILFDGKRTIGEVLAAGVGITREDIDQMVELGLLGLPDEVQRSPVPGLGSHAVTPAPSQSEVAVATVAVPRSAQQRYADAYPIAIQLTGGLGLRGFRLNLAVEGTSTYQELLQLAPKIRAAVGVEKAAALERALGV